MLIKGKLKQNVLAWQHSLDLYDFFDASGFPPEFERNEPWPSSFLAWQLKWGKYKKVTVWMLQSALEEGYGINKVQNIQTGPFQRKKEGEKQLTQHFLEFKAQSWNGKSNHIHVRRTTPVCHQADGQVKESTGTTSVLCISSLMFALNITMPRTSMYGQNPIFPQLWFYQFEI